MRRLARHSFTAAAVLSLLLLVFVTWLCWGEGRELGFGSILVHGHERNVTFIAGNFRAATTGTRTWQWGNLYAGLANNHRFAFAQIPRWLILASASILPAAWMVLTATKRRRLTAHGFHVDRADHGSRGAGRGIVGEG
jgi:hypothetical protein